MSLGKGMWPNWEFSTRKLLTGHVYGANSPCQVSLNSLYGMAFLYADKTCNYGRYSGSTDHLSSDPRAITAYFEAVSEIFWRT